MFVEVRVDCLGGVRPLEVAISLPMEGAHNPVSRMGGTVSVVGGIAVGGDVESEAPQYVGTLQQNLSTRRCHPGDILGEADEVVRLANADDTVVDPPTESPAPADFLAILQ